MKIFLSALEARMENVWDTLEERKELLDYGLVSYFYIRGKDKNFSRIQRNTKEILVDSGAHSFQKGKKVEWEEYTREYAEWIKKNDSDKILGYFEMDVDNIIGYEKVLELRKILLEATDKIIPVWHKNRGIDEFKKMCKETKGEIIGITGFRNEDIKDDQYHMFLKYAWQQGKKVHCLGMTRIKVLNEVPFDYTDSSSWRQTAIYGTVKRFSNGKFKDLKMPKRKFGHLELVHYNFFEYRKMSKYFERKWKNARKKYLEEFNK